METSKSLLLAGWVARVAGHHKAATQTQAARQIHDCSDDLLVSLPYIAEAKPER